MIVLQLLKIATKNLRIVITKMIYVDAAASALKPRAVIDAEIDFLSNKYANSGRGICMRATNVDKLIQKTRKTTVNFLNAKSADQIIFTNGTTDGLNRIAKILDNSRIKYLCDKSVILVSDLDHHAARMPFEELGRRNECNIKVAKLDDNFNIIAEKCDIFVITAMSNVLGNAQDVKKIIKNAKTLNPNVITIVDAAQYVAHLPIDASDWDPDFLCFSGHKIGSDTGVGVMYIKNPERWYPDKFGGGMISSIDGDNWIFSESPEKFEAGTLALTQIIGLDAAIKELKIPDINVEKLTKTLQLELGKNKRIKFLTNNYLKLNPYLTSFTIDDMNPLDFGILIGTHDICLRIGHMCASWIHKKLEITGSIRISLGPWNTELEIEQLIKIISQITNLNSQHKS